MITIYNNSNNKTYQAALLNLTGIVTKESFTNDLFPEIDPGLKKKWDPYIDKYVMTKEKMNEWVGFWKWETERASYGISNLLDVGFYYFYFEPFKEV